MSTVLTFYGKAGCHLCDDARAAVAEAVEGLDVRIEEVDVSLDPGLNARFGERIPVGTIGDRELFESFVDAGALRAALVAGGAPDGRR